MRKNLLHRKQFLKILWSEFWKGWFKLVHILGCLGMYVLWCCGSVFQELFTFIHLALTILCLAWNYFHGFFECVPKRFKLIFSKLPAHSGITPSGGWSSVRYTTAIETYAFLITYACCSVPIPLTVWGIIASNTPSTSGTMAEKNGHFHYGNCLD